MKIVREENVSPSSTNPTRPFTRNTIDEHLDMLMVCHHLDPSIPEDVAFAKSRIRARSMIRSDSQAMGRVGEVITRTWQTADKMKQQLGPLAQDAATSSSHPDGPDDNQRILRYLAKYTINPAIAHGMSHLVGSIDPGKLANLVLWKPFSFGAKPKMVVKGGPSPGRIPMPPFPRRSRCTCVPCSGRGPEWRGRGRDVHGVRFEIGRGGGDEREVGVGEGGGGGGGDEARGEEGYGEERCHAGCEHRSGDVRGGGGWEEVVVRAFGEGVVGAAFLFVLGVGKLECKERNGTTGW
mmetsp:Transcript_20592/g.42245  ORF Transcript_20592/g.42245 Transcript_20592/m.42245 type:complete len:294 (-) Transcript_20592:184-1065(-)